MDTYSLSKTFLSFPTESCVFLVADMWKADPNERLREMPGANAFIQHSSDTRMKRLFSIIVRSKSVVRIMKEKAVPKYSRHHCVVFV
jgi:hypothetical protein